MLELRPNPEVARSKMARNILMEGLGKEWEGCETCREGSYRYMIDVITREVREEIENAIEKVRQFLQRCECSQNSRYRRRLS